MRASALFTITMLLCLTVTAQGADSTPAQVIAVLRAPTSSTGNISDAVDEATGARVVELIAQHDEKERKELEIINETGSMREALERYNRY